MTSLRTNFDKILIAILLITQKYYYMMEIVIF